MAPSRLALWITLALCALIALGCPKDGAWWYGHWGKNESTSIETFYNKSKDLKHRGAVFKSVTDALVDCGIKHVYGYYRNKPRKINYLKSDPAWVASWNEYLHKADRKSWLLLASPEWLNNPFEFAQILQESLGHWYSKTPPVSLNRDSFFKGIHLDVEPEQLDECKLDQKTNKARNQAECRMRLYDLLSLVQTARLWIKHNAPDLKLSIYLDHSYSELDYRVAWSGAKERDDWYKAIDSQVHAITVMASSKHADVVEERISWEWGDNSQGKKNMRKEIRIGLTWKRFLPAGVDAANASPQQREQAAKDMMSLADELKKRNDDYDFDFFSANELLAGPCK